MKKLLMLNSPLDDANQRAVFRSGQNLDVLFAKSACHPHWGNQETMVSLPPWQCGLHYPANVFFPAKADGKWMEQTAVHRLDQIIDKARPEVVQAGDTVLLLLVERLVPPIHRKQDQRRASYHPESINEAIEVGLLHADHRRLRTLQIRSDAPPKGFSNLLRVPPSDFPVSPECRRALPHVRVRQIRLYGDPAPLAHVSMPLRPVAPIGLPR
mmetsp:Transcript_73697/g.216275  ORF Transcript_73697/g.216275 Transcript_73697/m.216275 type:complete len:212 (-) Transcript_73697:347-982(-)